MIQDFRPPSGKIILFTHVSGVVSAFVLVAGLQWLAVRANTESESPQPIVMAAPQTPANQTTPNQAIARQAWQYFAQNWQASGLVKSTADQTSTTLADIATTIVALTSARELDIIAATEFDQKLTTLLNTLEKLGLDPNQPASNYDVETGVAVTPELVTPELAAPDELAQPFDRLARSLKLVADRYPQHKPQVDRIQQSWPTSQPSQSPVSNTTTTNADIFTGIESGFPTLSPTAIDRLLAAEITQRQATAPLTANTNGLILSSLLYQKVQQPLLNWAGGKTP